MEFWNLGRFEMLNKCQKKAQVQIKSTVPEPVYCMN